ncbi:MAG: hypothetical protein MUO61_00785 [Dehalococcoidia bacterium]|nr:hypothetical protein [Dehalococcoidia bacterium]
MEPAAIAGVIGASMGVIAAGVGVAFLINRKRLAKLCNIDIAIQKFNYDPGDIISGDVALTLKKPVKVSELSISLIGEQWIRQEQAAESRSILGYGKSRSISTNKNCVYEFKQQLDSNKEYSQGQQYHFEIKIPAAIPGKRPQTTRAFSFPVKWYLSAELDMTRAFPISKTVDITIG